MAIREFLEKKNNERNKQFNPVNIGIYCVCC